MTPKFKLDAHRDVDMDDDGPILNLPRGWCFDDPGNTPHDTLHTRGYDTMRELRAAIKTEVIPCNCNGCAPARVLSQAQAETVYNAMVALNNIGGRINKMTLPATYYVIEVIEAPNGSIVVSRGPAAGEVHRDQIAFAAAYSL